MVWAANARLVARAVCALLGTLFVYTTAFAVEPVVPSSVDVYWKSTHAISAPGVTSVIVLDEEVAHAQLGNDVIEFAGLSRGETVALAYVKGNPVSIVVHVIERPVAVIPPSLLQRQAEMAHGTFGSDVQASNGAGSSLLALSSMSWSQQTGDAHLDVNSLVEDNSQFGGHTANLRTGGISYRMPHLAINVIDFNQTLTGASPEDHINNFSSPGVTELRGAAVAFQQGKNEYDFFAGTTIPYYFLSLNATRDVAGISFHRRQTRKLNFYGSTAYVNIPTTFTGAVQRRAYVMQNAGVSYRIGKGFLLGAEGGISNGGRLWRVDSSYGSFRLSAYASVIFASQTFPLNQLQSLFAGTSAIKGGASYRMTSRLTPGFYFDHTDVAPGLIYRVAGSNDYLSPNLGLHLSRGESLNFAYTYSRNTGGFTASTTTGNRYDASLSSQITQRISNSAQVTVGSIQDPLQINSQDQFSVRDAVSIPIKGQTLLLGVEHDRVNPSLIAKLNQELSLLSPALQADFQANPTAFIDSANFPAEIKALLAAEQPTGTTFSASTNLAIGSKLRFNPNFSITQAVNGSQSDNWTQGFGYSLTYQLRPTFQLRSSLSNVFLWSSQQNSVLRTMVLSAGFQKNFTTAPGELPLLHRSRVIEGRVFRDNNINGAYNVGEPGLEGIEVRLDDGQVVVTDAQGRYKFPSVSADQHEVSIALTQFRNPVRMTTRSEADVDLIQQRIAIANFGILDFARLMGSVYNDLRFENHRQPDSRGMQDTQLLLDNGKEVRKIQTNGSGEFEVDNIAPGDYKLSLETASMPPNYQVPRDTFAIHVTPVSTVLQDIPVRALRSISGQVLLKANSNPNSVNVSGGKQSTSKSRQAANSNQDFKLVPVAGVEIVAGSAAATTDDDGKFLLRNLPAGDLNVTVRPVKPVPSGINIPSGQVKLPPDPVQIQGATIVITNGELLPYLTRDIPGAPRAPAEPALAAGKPSRAAPAAVPVPAPVKAVENAKAANPAQPPVSTLPTTEPPASRATAQPVEGGTIIDGNLTRAICQQLPSLGEIAHCLQQLKQSRTTGPQK
jgi:hypothetical protein